MVTASQFVARPVMKGREAGEEREVERTIDCVIDLTNEGSSSDDEEL